MQMRKKDDVKFSKISQFHSETLCETPKEKKRIWSELDAWVRCQKTEAMKLFGDFLRTVNKTTMFKNVTQCLQNKLILLWIKSLP